MKQVSEAVVPADRAAELIPYLKEQGCVDLSARITSADGAKLVPILPGKESIIRSLGLSITSGPAYSEESRPPMERIRERLEAVLGAKTALLPDKWEIAGDVVTVKMDPALFEFGELIGRTYAEVLSARSVLADVSGVSGEFREPDMTLLYGPSGESVKLENGIRYCFDVTKVMFASGNLAERKRMKCLDCTGETVVDMFCGIGYFTLPLAKYSGARRVFACEKNPQSYGFLLKNLALNEINNVIPLLGDNRDIPGKAFADRILMGYVQTTSVFVPKALEMAKPGCMIHYHDTFPVGKEEKMIREIFDRYCSEYTIERIIEVKSFAPGVSHYVADIRV
ncbi:MAG: class I SAM-dependent methyltransferase family protein [Candidatus Methanomethylophilus sp.]|nr:class I SAM-dependent methyltransferase family protein [Methanomethylophilus sp.]